MYKLTNKKYTLRAKTKKEIVKLWFFSSFMWWKFYFNIEGLRVKICKPDQLVHKLFNLDRFRISFIDINQVEQPFKEIPCRKLEYPVVRLPWPFLPLSGQQKSLTQSQKSTQSRPLSRELPSCFLSPLSCLNLLSPQAHWSAHKMVHQCVCGMWCYYHTVHVGCRMSRIRNKMGKLKIKHTPKTLSS